MNKEIFRTIKFTFFSASAGLIQIGTFTLFLEVCKFPYIISYLVSLILSVLWNFTLNRNFTFKSSNNVSKAMFLVGIYYIIFTPLSTYLGNLIVEHGVNEYVVEIGTMLVNFITEYIYDRFVVFGKSIDTKTKKEKN